MIEFRMPSLGADMEAGKLVEWLVKPGDRVKRGDIVAVVETQKGAIEIEIYEAGIIDQLLVDLDAVVPVGTTLARLRAEGEGTVPPSPPLSQPSPPPMPPAEKQPVQPPIEPSRPTRVAAKAPASPAARRLAQQHAMDLATVTGSGPGGAITYSDVEQALGRPAAAADKKRAPGLDLAAMRAAIAAAMARSKREIPHYYLQHEVDVTACEQWLTQTNASRPPDSRLLIGAVAIKAVASACRRFQAFNGFYRDNKFEPSSAVHVGVAIAIRGGGLTAPALRDTDQLSLDELMHRMRDLVQRTRVGRIRSSEISDPTITVSSLGDRGVEALYGVIYPPQVAIVGFGKVTRRPWVIDDDIGPRSVVTITLSGDHRVSDGHAGALFLAEIGRLLQEPDKL